MEVFLDAPYWNYPQVAVWVFVGDRSAVKTFADDDKSEGVIRVEVRLPDGHTEWIDEDIGPPEPLSLQIRARNGSVFDDYESAEKAIVNELIAERLTCYALRNNEGDFQPIPALHWLDLKFRWDRDYWFAGPTDLFRENAPRWTKLRFRREQVLECWPDLLTALHARKPTTHEISGANQRALAQWLDEFFKKHCSALDRSKPPPSEDEDHAAAEKELGEEIVREPFRTARRKAYANAKIELKSGRPGTKPATANKKAGAAT